MTLTVPQIQWEFESKEVSPYLVLVEFSYKHLDFQLAELESILELHGIQFGTAECRLVPLPLPKNYDEIKKKRKESTDHKPCRNFVILEFPTSKARLLAGESMGNEYKGPCHFFDPCITIPASSKSIDSNFSIAQILYKCTLVKTVIELWGYSSLSLEDCASRVHEWITLASRESFQQTMLRPIMSDSSQSWKFSVHTLGTKFSREEQDQMRLKFQRTLDMIQGPVRMDLPSQEYVLIREIELDGQGSPFRLMEGFKEEMTAIQLHSDDSRTSQHAHPQQPAKHCTTPLAFYFGRVLGGPRQDSRGLEQFTLKNRPYLGPTSMDAELSFVMTSLGLVKKGSVVFDPFVGTGSILLSCALRGAYCIGSDIDIRVLRGKGGNQQIWKNFEYYKLPRPEIIRSDNALYKRHFRHHKVSDFATNAHIASSLYDAIITDPPYGIRAGARKTGSKRDHIRPVLEEARHDHIAQTVVYPVSDVMSDLLDMAARTLSLGGRLVYVIPSFRDFDPHSDLPRHDCLQMTHSCYQSFGNDLGRRVVSMKKVTEYREDRHEEYLKNIWVHGAASAEKCVNLREKILERARQKPGYEEKAAIRKQKRRAHKNLKRIEKCAKIRDTA